MQVSTASIDTSPPTYIELLYRSIPGDLHAVHPSKIPRPKGRHKVLCKCLHVTQVILLYFSFDIRAIRDLNGEDRVEIRRRELQAYDNG